VNLVIASQARIVIEEMEPSVLSKKSPYSVISTALLMFLSSRMIFCEKFLTNYIVAMLICQGLIPIPFPKKDNIATL